MSRFPEARVENIVMTSSRQSFLVKTIGEDSEYVYGHFCDLRAFIVNTTLTKFAKTEIALRTIIVDEKTNLLPGDREVKYDHHTKDYVGVN